MKQWKSILQVGDIMQRCDGSFRMVINKQCYSGIRGYLCSFDYKENLQTKRQIYEEFNVVAVYRVPFTSEELQDIKNTYGEDTETGICQKHYKLFEAKVAMIKDKDPRVNLVLPLKLPDIF